MSWFPLYGSTILTEQVLRNPTAGLIWPTFEITGPGFYPILTNLTTGKYYSLPAEIRYGDLYRLSFDPSHRFVSSEYGGVPSPDAGSEPWPIVLGDNLVRVELGRTTGQTRIRVIRVPTLI